MDALPAFVAAAPLRATRTRASSAPWTCKAKGGGKKKPASAKGTPKGTPKPKANAPQPPVAKAAAADPFAGLAAGPGKVPRTGGVLGRGGRKEPAAIPKKTAADFVAEGVVDDVDDDAVYEEADIRFAIADMKDPFKADERRRSVAEAKGGESDSTGGVGVVGDKVDVLGDAGVLKTVLVDGRGEVLEKGAAVTVHYVGRLADGSVFDESRGRGPFEFVLGGGAVIKGWEAGVATMRVGETAVLECAPAYAYGRRGMPPVVPGGATLSFEVEVLAADGGGDEDRLKNVADFNPEVSRTPDDISRDYEERLRTQNERREKMTFLEKFYIISPFASQTGEKPPWFLNPLITFSLAFVVVGLAFYVVLLSDGVHQGYVTEPVNVNIFDKIGK